MNVPDITSTNAMNLSEKRSAADLRRRQAAQKLSFGLFWLGALVVILIMLVVVGYVFITGFKSINLQFLTTPPKGGLSGEGGISTTVITTLYLVGLILAISAPLGIGAAVFLIEYQGQTQSGGKFIRSLLQVVNFGVETLAGIPSIIFGLFGYALFVSTLKFGFSLLSAALAGACLVLPTIIRTTQEALLTVPVSLREGSLALGATSASGASSAKPRFSMLPWAEVTACQRTFFRAGGRFRCTCSTWPWTPMPLRRRWEPAQF